MALPVVKNALECTDFENSVAPYLYQLQPLPAIIFESITNPTALKQIYLDTNPLITSLAFSIALTPVVLVVSEINKNYSQVDRLWSILPSIYNIHYAYYAYMAGLDMPRIGAVALVSTVWSCRLTYNYFRRGGYTIGSEDYRWEVVKDYCGPTLMFLFNVIFISLAQSLLLFIVTAPTYVILLLARLTTVSSKLPSWTIADSLSLATMLSLIALTAFADQQQWNFQNAKTKYRQTAKVPAGYKQSDLERGFNTVGLFAYVRKPNYAFEQAVWVALYAWSCAATGTWHNWSGIGAAAYLCLFQASTWITELLSERRYPAYQQYRKQVGKFIPTSMTPPIFGKSQAKVSNGPASPSTDKDAAEARKRYDLR
jgi:steroid 5-alpha reductase family enzyme